MYRQLFITTYKTDIGIVLVHQRTCSTTPLLFVIAYNCVLLL